ncbi:MAG TPA: NAD-dependent succinate-semialdehyde dehydrogenase [Candidatus Rubrimentiphilum sp.]|nr:NAD-dependent succinate-semialdehyde dehydrogenase [Candidatus Rubrimentiphilum sp.]
MASDILTVNPTTGKTLETFDYMQPAEIDAQLDTAAEAFVRWRRESFASRARVLKAIAGALRAERQRLAETAVCEMGKPIGQALAEVDKCAWCCDFFAEKAEELLAERAVESNATRSAIAFRPLGVIFAIMPWNFPYWQVVRASAPALMAGNTIILKHADSTTRCALEIQRIFESAEVHGLLRTLLISNEEADRRIADERIAAVTLTGSERAGVAVAAAAGTSLKKCVLELGGSDPFIVLGDANVDMAIEFAVKARFQNNGQSCIAAKRFIVEDRIYDRFVRSFADAAKAQRVGDPMDERTQIGPCARRDLRDNLERQVTETVIGGGRIVTGGKVVDGPGFFFEPTVVADVDEGEAMFDQETFGPAAAVTRARDDQHALELANDSTFGLGANIWTRDIDHALSMASEIESGMVFVNGMVASDPRLPFGGVKRSGYGRELSDFGIHEFVNIQTVWVGPERRDGQVSSPSE